MDFKTIYEFLIDLQFNNTRNWFKENENRYQAAKKEFSTFVDAIIVELKKFDQSIDVTSSKECLFRIFKDVRFSINKDPYKTNFGAFIAHGGRKSNFAGYYIHIEPDQSFIGGGIYMPQPQVLLAIRNSIFEHPSALRKIIEQKEFKDNFEGIFGEKLKTAPKGFPKDFEEIDLLRHKHFAVTHKIGEDFWESDDVLDKTIEVFKSQFEFNSYLNAVVDKIEQ